MKIRIFALFVLAIFLSACSFSLAEDITPPPGSEQLPPVGVTQPAPVSETLYPLVPPNPENGKSIYTEKCAPCHGDTGMGDGFRAAQLPNPVAPLGSLDVARQSTPARWYTQVTQGNLEKFMPPFSSLTDRERWDVVAYAFSLSMPVSLLEQGEALYQANCARCHGENGSGDGQDAASLPQPPRALNDQSVMAEKSAADVLQAIMNGVPPAMPGFSADLSEEDAWALAAFLRSLTFTSSDQPIAETQPPASTSAEPGAATQISATPVAAAAAGMGSVTGKITAADDIELPAGLEVTLHGFDDMQVAITQTTTTQADGSFAFTNVEIPSGRVFLATVEYQNASYGSDIGMLEAGMTSLDLPITVYSTTTDASILKADRLHLFFEFLDAQTVRVIELYVVSNPTDKTLVAASPSEPTVRFNLPEGAANLEFQDGALGGRYIQLPEGFGDTAAVRPGSGSYEVLFAYEMLYDRKLELEHEITMPVDAVVILVPEGDIKIKSDMLEDGGTRDVQGTQYHSYTGGSLLAGQPLRLTLTGKPTSGGRSLASGSDTSLLVGLGAFGAALIVGGVWLYRRSRRAEAVYDDEDDFDAASPAAEDNQESLIDAIIALDDLYQAGQLPDEAYQQRRAELKGKLSTLLKG